MNNLIALVGNDRADSLRPWELMPPLTGIDHLGVLKDGVLVFAQSPGPRAEPVMVGAEAGKGRSLAFAGETWGWALRLRRRPPRPP